MEKTAYEIQKDRTNQIEIKAAYKAMGCVHAIEINTKLAEEEPCDVQLEYDFFR